MTKRDKIESELNEIKEANGGIINPRSVVEFARENKRSALHSKFEWNNGKAAELYRLNQARAILRVYVVDSPDNVSKIRAFVSLPSDRNKDGGYRDIDSVMNDAERRAELLKQALREFAAFRRKYAILQEFAKVFAAADEVDAA